VGFHHVAVATTDLEATHRFYTEATGFELVNVDVIPFLETGWARHVFYDTGNGELFAIWDLHHDDLPAFDPGISTGLGLPNFVNHIAFSVDDIAELDRKTERWVANGYDVVRVDHGWCTSIYANDPNGTMVEFCSTTRAFTAADRRLAEERLAADAPEIDRSVPPTAFFEAGVAATH